MVINGVSGGSSSSSHISSTTASGIAGFFEMLGIGIGLIIFVYILINILFLIIVGNIAKSKGLSSVLWAVLALIFGLPILIIVLLLPNYNNQTIIYNNTTYSYNKNSKQNESGVLKRQNTSKIKGEKWACPKCGQLNIPGAQNCINCYEKNINLTTLKKWYCPSCGELNVSSAVHCINCFETNPHNRRPTVSKGKVWTCPNCGEENVERAQYCINCFTKKP